MQSAGRSLRACGGVSSQDARARLHVVDFKCLEGPQPGAALSAPAPLLRRARRAPGAVRSPRWQAANVPDCACCSAARTEWRQAACGQSSTWRLPSPTTYRRSWFVCSSRLCTVSSDWTQHVFIKGRRAAARRRRTPCPSLYLRLAFILRVGGKRGRARLRGQRVVVADAQLLHGDRVVLIDDRHGAVREQLAERGARVRVLPALRQVVQRQQHLRARLRRPAAARHLALSAERRVAAAQAAALTEPTACGGACGGERRARQTGAFQCGTNSCLPPDEQPPRSMFTSPYPYP